MRAGSDYSLMQERARRNGTREVVGAALTGPRTIFQDDQDRPRCPHCATRLRPGMVLNGWSPGPRRRQHYCLVCNGGWSVVSDPAELVSALADYWLARNGLHGELRLAESRLAALHLEIPRQPPASAAS
ncbi:hypothetical protein FHS29_004770 [Saccharothrix tamanrassetensis]|uniref:Uncharacterized protein n=1 Tax=Saccharothrix tamanrassetensis TaxID=1051531 RepID=A0A841CI09_9PSEU|nr:hypothetical protein [Saccharothrix tamanrassetensis]MBB5958162.1 hypothetical protein [Saccharothrix tamanrassetensis]